MRLITFLIFVSVASVTANSYSQQTKFNLRMENITVRLVLQEIEKTSEFIFIYSEKSVDVNRKVDVKVEDETVNSILDQLFKGTNNYYEIHDRQIVILPSESKELQPVLNLGSEVEQPQKKELAGMVTDSEGLPLPGVSIVVKGTTIGTITDTDGRFKLSVPQDAKILMFSFVGMKTQEFLIVAKSTFNVVLSDAAVGIEEVVAVGYGIQKKASVVGAITTTTFKELQRTGGVTNMAQALTGNLPGITTIQSSGQPGRDDPKILIRGQSTWNGSDPYILVDGVERRMNDLDMSEVDNISVLKDASATAVYGVKGANGVILITTKRGSIGKPVLTVSANSTMKMPSRMLEKLDSYSSLMIKDEAIEREVAINENSWADYNPQTIVERYRNQQKLKYPEAYPNIDWEKEMFKNAAMDHRININIAGGTDFAKYFSSLAYLHEGDLVKHPDNGKGYNPGFGYDRLNFRTNLDLNITKSTVLKINLAGLYSYTKDTYSNNESALWGSMYGTPPDAFMPRYADGSWGLSPVLPDNPVGQIANTGIRKTRRTELNSDFSITQKLNFITDGLSITGKLSFDNRFESQGGIYDVSNALNGGNTPVEWINPAIEDALPNEDLSKYYVKNPIAGTNQFGFVVKPWLLRDENADTQLSSLLRRLFYQAQVNYVRTFGKHDISATGVFNREQLATGSEFQRYREDWVFRATYNYNNRYSAEINGAYNGSEKFGTAYRFAFFPSIGGGWTISNEKFMNKITWLDKLKLRYSYGLIGDDSGTGTRWLYASQWSYGGKTLLGDYSNTNSPYTMYAQSSIGNPDIHWEKATKSNLGLEMAVLKNMISGNVEYFTEDRTDIMLAGSSRSIPIYFGGTAPTANIGHVTKNGYEVELRFNKNLNKDLHFWANASVTHVVNKVLYKEEPALKDSYQLAKDFPIGQVKSTITDGFLTNWNDVYASTPLSSNNLLKQPGDYFLIDFNGDGVIDSKDSAPYGYTGSPQNTFSYSFGTDYKGFSFMVQFYGVNNVTRFVNLVNFNSGNTDLAFQHVLDYWTKDNPNATSFLPHWKVTKSPTGNYYQYDGSYLRLKNAEIAYTFGGKRLKGSGISSLRLYLNGNNLIFWSKLPDDRESGSDFNDAYPTSKRINLGVDIKF